jgi:rifampicin phosphotransferase
MHHFLSPLIELTAAQAADSAVTGSKFARLAAARDLAEIPAAWCVPVGWLSRALGPGRLNDLADLFHDLAATAGNELINLDARLAVILDGLELEADLWAAVAGIADTAPQWAVRSSALTEDGDRHSHAGLYDSFLGRRGTAEIAASVLACWRSFYSPRAILARLRAADTDPSPRMAVIIQNMVEADLAGVAFTQPGHTIVSAVIGTGDTLVAGTVNAARCDLPATGSAPPPYDSLTALTETLKRRVGREVDIEWAWNRDGVRLLQVRPVTAALGDGEPHGPAFAAASLYFSDTIPGGIVLGDCAPVYVTATSKRSALFRLAADSGVAVDDGWIITLNGAGLTSPAHRPAWWAQLDGEVVIDLSASVRQNIIPAGQLQEFLTTTLNLTRDPSTRHTFLLRRFIRGEAGAITRRQPDGRVVMEHSGSGLLALNRGLAVPHVLSLPATGDHRAWNDFTAPEPWSARATRQMASFTDKADAIYPGASLEWALHNCEPHFIDYSATAIATPASTTTEGTVLSPGTARGPLFLLDEDTDALARLSIAPIVSITRDADVPESRYISGLLARIDAYPSVPVVYARLPYVILSRLVGHVAGFVFGGGSPLCHLGILLREAGVPAIVAARPETQANGSLAVIDSGKLHLVTATHK